MNNEIYTKSFIDFDKIIDLMGGEDKHLKEFCEAAVNSFTNFKNEYEQYVLNRNLEKLRRTGHRVRPVAQMLGLQILIDEYEKVKQLLIDDEDDEKLKASVKNMQVICNEVVKEFRDKEKKL